MASLTSPSLVAPSPKKTNATSLEPLYLKASAAPAATGTDAAIALMIATMFSRNFGLEKGESPRDHGFVGCSTCA